MVILCCTYDKFLLNNHTENVTWECHKSIAAIGLDQRWEIYCQSNLCGPPNTFLDQVRNKFLEDIEADFTDVLYQTNVCRLSMGKCYREYYYMSSTLMLDVC